MISFLKLETYSQTLDNNLHVNGNGLFIVENSKSVSTTQHLSEHLLERLPLSSPINRVCYLGRIHEMNS